MNIENRSFMLQSLTNIKPEDFSDSKVGGVEEVQFDCLKLPLLLKKIKSGSIIQWS